MLRIRLDRFCLDSLGVLAFGTLQDWLSLSGILSEADRSAPVTGHYDCRAARDELSSLVSDVSLSFSSLSIFFFFSPSLPFHSRPSGRKFRAASPTRGFSRATTARFQRIIYHRPPPARAPAALMT